MEELVNLLARDKPLRKCVMCGLKAYTKKDLDYFKYNKPSKFGRQNLCKDCDIKETVKWQKANPTKYKNLQKKMCKKNTKNHLNNVNKWKNCNPEKAKAHYLAEHYIALSVFCEDCRCSENLERHHPNYSKPLEVVTLCKKCHTLRHKKADSS